MPLPVVGLAVALVVLAAAALIVRRRLADAPTQCSVCDRPLSLVDRLLGREEDAAHRVAPWAGRAQARARYLGAITAFDLQTTVTPSEQRILAEVSPAALGTSWHRRVATSAILFLLDRALLDGIVTADEDARIAAAAALAQISLADVVRSRPGLDGQLVMARANDGRTPVVPNPTVRLRRGEVCHFEAPASLMTDAAGGAVPGQPGVSAINGTRTDYERIAGLLSPLDPQLHAWDAGKLLVTDRRLLFEGARVSIQVPHRQVIRFALFKDGVQVQIAGRRTEPIFRVAEPFLLTAIAHGAWQKSATDPRGRALATDSFDGWPATPAGSLKSE